ncbi:Fe-S protein assembly chaperone HscA [Ferruginibacter yonginensis]|uniref:Fe-S protein assembly chaperone HscA n=1 Tax=Ferruginibacter yonginensis TaxID=1310416 RepID=A0ABV8QQT1_9BACT
MAKIAINIATGSLQKDEIIVGIDLGTTNSLVAMIHPDTKKAVALKEHDSSSLVPSVVYFDHNGGVIVGNEAKAFLETAPERTIFSAKRLLGKNYNDIKSKAAFFAYKIIDEADDRQVKIKIDEQYYSPVDLSSLILKELKKRAEHILKTPVNKAVITVPAYFNDAQRQATRDAGKLAGLDVLRIINEPTAASLAYGIGLHQHESATIAVYDLGGGTFDVSILRLNGGVFEVLSTNGDTYLGGDDFDNAIVAFWKAQYGFTNEQLATDASLAQTLRLQAEAAKKHLSTNELFETNVNGKSLQITITQFNELIKTAIETTITCCKKALKDAGITKSEIDEIIMVGGSTRVPLVNEMVGTFFGKPVNNSVNPDEVVALGAAIQADILAGNNKEVLLLDITPLSLGIETAGELMDVLIPRNAKIPSSAAREYTTQLDGQMNMRISVYQGERDIVKDNRLLATLNLKGIPAMPAGMAKVQVAFMINADGILTVRAKELRSGVEQSIEVKPQIGLDDSTVEKMLLDSMQHAQADIAARALAEAKTEGEQLLKTTERFLQKNANLLIGTELHDTAAAMQALQLALTMDDKNLVQQKTEALNDISRPYAERIMNNAVGAAMKGKII